jgi:hypothetical protein
MAEELGVETTETPKSKNHRSELLLGASNVGSVPCADQLPEPLVVRRPMPQLAHAPHRHQRPRVHTLHPYKSL